MKRIYLMEPLRQRLFLLAGVVVGGFGLVWPLISWLVLGELTLDILDVLVVGLPSVAFLAAGAYVIWAGRVIRLELTEAAIVLRLPGGFVETDWEDVREIGPAMWGPLSGQALILNRPARGRRPWWTWFLSSPIMERAIPLSPFALPLLGSRLEADLRSRLPNLFD